MRVVRVLLILTLACAVVFPGRADVVILKDGTILHGKLLQDSELVLDKEIGPIPMAKGFFMVDDGVRRVIFPSRQIPNADAIDTRDTLSGPGVEMFQTSFARLNTLKMEGLGLVTQITPWNAKWERSITFLTTRGPETVKQKLQLLTPHSVWVGADRYRWKACYLTKEFGAEQVKSLLQQHPDLVDKGGVADPAKRLRIFRFLMQAGWFHEADQELDALLKDAPDQKAKVDEARKTLRGFQAQHFCDDLEQASKAGQHQSVLKWLERFPRADADERQQIRFRALQRKYEEGQEAIAAARKYLNSLPPLISPEEHKRIFGEAAAAIQAELGFDNHARLKSFLDFAKQSERMQAQGLAPTCSPSELLALAVSGWLQSGAAAETDVPGAIKLWKVRQLIREYQKTHHEGSRQALLLQIERLAVEPELVALIIRHLPPPEPEETLPTETAELQTNLPGRAQPVNFVLRLPKEYQHGRSYPVLLVLNAGTETAQNTLQRWLEPAQKHGYILVAVDWTEGGKRQGYGYTAAEHALVLDTLRDLQRRFNVDSDRVFLAGLSEGGAMAYDVGLSHPDLFAGVVPICGLPRHFAMAYSSNGGLLPFYVVCGDLAPADFPKTIRRQFESWVTRAHTALYIEYKGRGLEWYDGELPYIFQWLERKTRDNAIPDTGDCCSMRPGDNRFYWLSGDSMDPRHYNDAAKWSSRVTPGKLSGKIRANNQISVMSHGFRRISIWLGPGMIDWKGKVSVSINTGSRLKDRELTQSLETLLEDFYQRGDRQRLFFLRLDFGA
jgi:pimeloyl-ACP methyl ester carboxylesterase